MTHAAKIAGVISGLIGIAVGVGVGFYVVSEIAGINEPLQIISARSVLSDFAARQFSYADIPHAREAALLEIQIDEQLQRAAPGVRYHEELVLDYTRLAMIEESAGRKDAERAALEQAKTWHKRWLPNDEITDEQLKSSFTRLERAHERSRL